MIWRGKAALLHESELLLYHFITLLLLKIVFKHKLKPWTLLSAHRQLIAVKIQYTV